MIKKKWQPVIYGVVVTLFIVGAIWLNYNYLNRLEDDYYSTWFRTNQWLTQGISPYAGNTPGISPFLNPLPAIFFSTLFGLFDFPIAFTLWQTLLEIAFAGLVLLSYRIFNASFRISGFVLLTILLIASFPAANAILTGDIKLLTTFFMVAVLYLLSRKMENGAGFLLTFAFVTPWSAVFFVLAVLIWSLALKKYQVLLSFLASFAFITILALVFMPDWLLQWGRALVSAMDQDLFPATLAANLAGLVPGLRKPLSLILHLIPAILLVWTYIRQPTKDLKGFLWAALLVLVYSEWLTLDMNLSVGLVLVPVLVAIVSAWGERWKLAGYASGWGVLLLIVVLSWMPVLLSELRGVSYSGYGMAALLSVIVWLILNWTAIWATRNTRLPLEILRDKFGS